MTDLVERLRAATMDKDNFPRMDSERQVPVGLAKEAADEIDRLNKDGAEMAAIIRQQGFEVERLTAVLQYIASLDDDGAAPVLARRALEHKP